MDLIRVILIEFEKLPLNHSVNKIRIEGYSDDEIIYHSFLLEEAGLVEIIDTTSTAGKDFLPEKLTWKGHEFLDNAKNDTIWKNVKSIIAEKGGNIGFSVLMLLVEQKSKEFFGLQ